MKLSISKSKNAEQLYICKSVRVSKDKTTSQIVRKLGSMASLLPKFGNDRERVIAWAKEQAAIMTAEENASALKIAIEVSENRRTEKNERLRFNCGYFFLEKLYYRLNLDGICRKISSKYKFEYDLSDILSRLVYTRIIEPTSKRSSFEASKSFVEQPSFGLHDIYRSLDVLAENSEEIQSRLYENSLKIAKRNSKILYYDCTNFFFEIEEEKGNRRYGKSKEHRPNPIVQMGLLTDGSGLPLAFTVFPGNESEQPSLKPLEERIIRDFKLSKFVVCTDAGLASAANRRFNNFSDRSFIVTQSLKKLKSYLRDWALNPEGWKLFGSDKVYNIENIDEETFENKLFYKERWINEDGLEQRLIVTYSIKYRNYQRAVRESQINRAESIVNNGVTQTRSLNSPLRFVDEVSVTESGEIAGRKKLSLSLEKISREAAFDGFYGVCTTLEDDTEEILNVSKQRWQIEAAFRTLKTEFRARPAYLQRENRLNAHFLTCFIALLIFRLLENMLTAQGKSTSENAEKGNAPITRNKSFAQNESTTQNKPTAQNEATSENSLNSAFTTEELVQTLRAMKLHKVSGFGYLSSYTRTDLTDRLHDTFGFGTDSEFISEKTMKKLLKRLKQE